MNTSPKTQQYLEQQQHANQLLRCQKAVSQPEQYICTTAVTTTAPTHLDPAIFLHYASSIAALIQGITLLVVAYTNLRKVLVPWMPQRLDEKIQTPAHKKIDTNHPN